MSTYPFVIHPHVARQCNNCAHDDAEFGCLNLVSMSDGSDRPADFACHEHQTPGEFRLDLHRYRHIPLFSDAFERTAP